MAAPGFGMKEPFPGFPPPLTTRPEGLLSMLGIQTNGRYPQHLEQETLQPGIDLLNWYLESRAEVLTVTDAAFTATNVGDFQSMWQVPTQEVWVLLNFTLWAGVAKIPTACRVQGARVRNNDDLSRIALTAEAIWAPGSLAMASLLDAARYIVLRPSVKIGFVLTSGGVVTNFASGTLRIARCTI